VKSRAGVTLIELLIAISLLSLLSVGILMAMRVGLNAMQKANAKLLDNRRVFSVQRILEQQLAGFMPEVADCLPSPQAPPVKMPFFQGEPQSMRFVSSYSLGEAARGYPRILEFQVIPGENNVGVRLVVNEHLYTGSLGAGVFCLGRTPDPLSGIPVPRFRPIEIGPSSFVLADRLAYCRFSYREIAPAPLLERWVPVWTKVTWPTAVRVEMAPLEPDPSRLQLLAITAPIRVNKVPFNWNGYAD
jgi:prepilin-type N-terminal cleavage/methylation domain-containing protein